MKNRLKSNAELETGKSKKYKCMNVHNSLQKQPVVYQINNNWGKINQNNSFPINTLFESKLFLPPSPIHRVPFLAKNSFLIKKILSIHSSLDFPMRTKIPKKRRFGMKFGDIRKTKYVLKRNV